MNYKNQLKEFIKREADKTRSTEQQMKCFMDGAHLLLPMLVESMEALEQYAHSNSGGPKITFYKADLARQTLKSINEKIEK